jgi:hypothetical protein
VRVAGRGSKRFFFFFSSSASSFLLSLLLFGAPSPGIPPGMFPMIYNNSNVNQKVKRAAMIDKRKGEVKETLLQVIMSEIHGTKTKIVDHVELFLLRAPRPGKGDERKRTQKIIPVFHS